MAELLISEVKRRPILWNTNHKDYHNRELVHRDWVNVAQNMGRTKEVVKGKWKNLRDTFRRELKKVKKVIAEDGTEQGRRYVGAWRYFGIMLFLTPVTATRVIQANMDDIEDSPIEVLPRERNSHFNNDNETSELSQFSAGRNTPLENQTAEGVNINIGNDQEAIVKTEIWDPEEEGNSLSDSVPHSTTQKESHYTFVGFPESFAKSPKSKEDPSTSSSFEEKLLDLESKKMSVLEKQLDDEDLYFFKSLLPHLRQLPPVTKLYFRSQVQNLLAHELSKVHNKPHHMNQPPAMT